MESKFEKLFVKGKGVPSKSLDNHLSSDDLVEFDEGFVDTPIPTLTWRSFVMGLSVSMGGFIFGYDTGQIAGVLETDDFRRRFGELEASGETYHFSRVRAGLIVALISIGTLIGALVAAPFADRFGRKWTMSGCCVIIIVGVIIQMTSEYPKWYQVVLGRWVAGLGVGALSVLVPLYQSESAPRHIRGAIISCYQLFNTLGILTANCINLGTGNRSDSGAWRIPLGVTFIRILILGIGALFFPDSPRYDYRAGRIDKAKKSLMRFYGIPHNHKRLHLELEGIREKYEEDMAAQDERWYHMFSAPGMKHRLLLGAALHGLHQLTGANFFFYTAATVFRGFGVQNRYISQVILGAIEFGGSCLSLYTVENFGRRKSLIVGATWMSVCCAVYASIGHFELNEAMPELTPSSGRAMVVVACLFMLGFASTWGPIVWVIIAEIYPSRYRARAMGFATASNWLWNFLLAFFTPFITEAIDFRYGYIFSGCLFVGVATVYFGVIEGKGRTIEEIDTMYSLPIPTWTSGDETPRNPPTLAGENQTSYHTGASNPCDISEPSSRNDPNS
ncbi:monosaccharide transporter [Histoplasma ohiense]|nr:monosaccharide transporter [Histoplasma ohiense (nom. inval.)]